MHDTQKINETRLNLETLDEIWVFGYGSLIYKVDFPFLEKRKGYIENWARRLWMESHDHRGTPSAPGRVLTLVPSTEQRCYGVAYRVKEDVMRHLNHREKNGYLLEKIDFHSAQGAVKNCIVYIGDTQSSAYSPKSNQILADIVFCSCGPSGENTEYVYLLADALRQANEHDEHIFDIERQLRKLEQMRME